MPSFREYTEENACELTLSQIYEEEPQIKTGEFKASQLRAEGEGPEDVFSNRHSISSYKAPKNLIPHHIELASERPENKTGPLLASILASSERPPRHMNDSDACSPTVIHRPKRVSVTRGEIEDEERLYATAEPGNSRRQEMKSNFSLKKSVFDRMNASGNSLLSGRGRTRVTGRLENDNKIIENIKENLSYVNSRNQSRDSDNFRDSGSSFERL